MKRVQETKNWLAKEYIKSHLQVKRIPFNDSQEWQWDKEGFLSHLTKRFFRVVGIRSFLIPEGRILSRPIIDQSEIGLLCFLVFKEHGEWWILVQAKVEPGNIGGAQLAPTVQATKSNYEAVHGGSCTPYLSITQGHRGTLYEQLQSEQNSCFFAKRNLNKVVMISEKIDEQDSRFKWMRIRKILPLLGQTHIVNTDARSVISCWLFSDLHALSQCLPAHNPLVEMVIKSSESENSLNDDDTIEQWLIALNAKWMMDRKVVSLKNFDYPWVCGESEIFCCNDPSLKVYQISVSCSKREVACWDQPIIGSENPSCIMLFLGDFRGTLHFLIQAKLEIGNRSGFELTSTVQAEALTIDDYEKNYVKIAEDEGKLLLSVQNSEEGGRFDRCVSEYKIVWLGNAVKEQESPFHRWISMPQLSNFLHMKNRITNELRSAFSTLLSINEI